MNKNYYRSKNGQCECKLLIFEKLQKYQEIWYNEVEWSIRNYDTANPEFVLLQLNK